MTIGVIEETPKDERTQQLTRWVASKTPRRSFLGLAGRLTLAVVGGGAAGLLLWEETAYAGGCCGASNSVGCKCLTGVNLCPSGTCECGCWTACTPQCGALTTHWCDCCDTSGCNTQCISGCNNKPKCCFPKEWRGGCGSRDQTIIRCRHYECGPGAQC